MSHARLAPSSAGVWGKCPGSVSMKEQFPREGDEGNAGEASHWVGSELLSTGAVHAAGESAPNGVMLDDEMVAGALTYAKAVAEVAPPGTTLYVEQLMAITAIHHDCFGTPDLMYMAGGELHVWDYKFGWGLVDVVRNAQLTCYAAGGLVAFAAPADTMVVFHIVQPRPHHALGPVREWRTTASEIAAAASELSTMAYEAVGPAPRVIAGSHCRYCEARHACPAARESMYAAFQYVEQARPHELTPEALAVELAVLERAEEAIKYLRTGVTAQAIGLINRGVVVPGWGIERGAGRAAWNVPAEQIFTMGDLVGVNVRQKPAPLTPVQAKQAGMPADVVDAFCSRPTGSPTLVRSDKSLTAQVFGPAAAARQEGAV